MRGKQEFSGRLIKLAERLSGKFLKKKRNKGDKLLGGVGGLGWGGGLGGGVGGNRGIRHKH